MGTTSSRPSPRPAAGGGPPRRVGALWARFRGLPAWLQALALLALVLPTTWLAAGAGGAGGAPTVEIAETGDADASAAAEQGEPATPEPTTAADEDLDTADPEAEVEVDPEPSTTATPVDGELEVHFLDVGQADATLLLHEEVAVLIDTGHWQGSDVVPALRARGVDALDLVVVTHPHADHIGQFDQVLDAVDVDEVWWSGSETTSRTFERALSALERSTATYEEPRAGDVTDLGPLGVEVLNPPPGHALSDLHDASLALRITYGEVRLLFTGDAEAATEARMTAHAGERLDADVLQLGHHGSRTSTTPPFLSAVDPAVAVYSAGAGNSYGHPHAEVVSRVEDTGIDLYGTDVHGSIVVRTDGAAYEVETDVSGRVRGAAAGQGDDAASTAEPAPEPVPPPGPGDCAPGQVDINSAGSDALEEIIHIGPERAGQIPALRPFADVQALERVSGIGPARLADIVSQGVACAG
jgi:competence protein ComEC